MKSHYIIQSLLNGAKVLAGVSGNGILRLKISLIQCTEWRVIFTRLLQFSTVE